MHQPTGRFLSTTVRIAILAALGGLWAWGAAPRFSAAADPVQWIWTPEHDLRRIPQVACYFRKDLQLQSFDDARLVIVADDVFELYVNGRRIGSGQRPGEKHEYEITKHLNRGKNVIAAKVTNSQGPSAGLAAKIIIKGQGSEPQIIGTDDSWKTHLRPLPLWNTTLYNDSFWIDARMGGAWDAGEPTDEQVADAKRPAAQPTPSEKDPARTPGLKDPIGMTSESSSSPNSGAPIGRFKAPANFEVQEIIAGEKSGSLLAMAFNEFGHLIVSREGGPLQLIQDTNNDGVLDSIRAYSEHVKNCQGILPLNGDVFVTADGDEGNGLYRLSDANRDGKLEKATLLVSFKGTHNEHGPHGLVLGPDGWIYIVVGNHSVPQKAYDQSPYHGWYEGDLVGPRYEDPGGHAVGIKAPGGVILRTTIEGDKLQCVAGGLRNAYDLAFNADGDLFVHDSDMETDTGMNWYRPTELFLITSGGEYGWRSGWSPWPETYLDNLPPIAKTGRGSPTGAISYNHFMFPKKYHGALFLGDWSEGRILAVKGKREGAGYAAETEVFLEGQPLNVTDLDVGPDGALYFVTGGRGTGGGVYRVFWKGDVPPAIKNLGEGISAAIRQPQPQSAWARQTLATLQQQLGERWDSQLQGVARATTNPHYYRTRALDLMQLLGPPPASEMLIKLSREREPQIRAKAAEMMGLHPQETNQERLVELLGDPDGAVRRRACEALLRGNMIPSATPVLPLLAAEDRFEAWAARRLLERIPEDEWRETVLTTDNHRQFIQGSLALLIAHPEEPHAQRILERFSHLLSGFISDPDFVDMLRVVEVALHRSGIRGTEIAELREQLADEFPSKNATINRELVRLIAYLQADSALDRCLEYLSSNEPTIEKVHLAIHLRFLESGWREGQKLTVLEYLQQARIREAGTAVPLYLANVSRDLARTVSQSECHEILSRGERWPHAALGALYALPNELDETTGPLVTDLYRRLIGRTDEPSNRLKVGLIAVLARSGDDAAYTFLRQMWDEDPERRQALALGMAQSPGGDNWDYLVRTLPVLEGQAAREILQRLATVERAPEDPEYVRQVILRGLTLKEQGGEDAVALLEWWTEHRVGDDRTAWEKTLQGWQEWFAEQYPDHPPALLPEPPKDSKWTLDKLLTHLSSQEGSHGSPEKGATVFTKAQCVKCHRFGSTGETMGPDLTNVQKRFMRREVLESILYPSHVISDQYAAKTVTTTKGRTYTGILAGGSSGETIVLQANGEKVSIPDEQIDEISPSKVSAMPVGLLDTLSAQEISDLFAFLWAPPSSGVARRKLSDAPK